MEKTIVLTLPRVENFRKIYESRDGVGVMYSASCPIKDIFDAHEKIDGLLEINPRTQKFSSVPSKAMRETLTDAPSMFVFRNRGLTFIARDAVWDNKINELTLTFELAGIPEQEINGLADGGHTYEVIKDFVEGIDPQESSEIKAEVRVDILTGFENKLDEVAAIVEARNTSTQVRDESLLNNIGVFNPIKEVLVSASYEDQIAYYENQRVDESDPLSKSRPIKIANVISYVMCFDTGTFTENDQPVQAYSSKKKALAWYEKKWNGTEEDREDLVALIALTPKILDLRDYIESTIPTVWNRWSGRFVDQKGVSKLTRERKLDFSDYTVDYDVPGGYVYPVLSAFRSILEKKNGKYQFKVEPKELFDRMNAEKGRSLVLKLKNTSDQDPQALGKNGDLYGACYASVLAYFYEHSK